MAPVGKLYGVGVPDYSSHDGGPAHETRPSVSTSRSSTSSPNRCGRHPEVMVIVAGHRRAEGEPRAAAPGRLAMEQPDVGMALGIGLARVVVANVV